KNHPAYATTLINCGTAYRMMDAIDKSYKCFKEAEVIIEKEGSDYLKASFHNNISSVLLKFNDYKAAAEHLLVALELLKTMKGQEIEIAVTYANLGSAYLCQHRLLAAKESLEPSEKLFMKYDPTNPHYAAVYSSFAQLAYEEDRLEEAIHYYDQALVLIKKNYGYNSDYHTVEYNKDKVEDLLNRRKHYLEVHLSGLELAEQYYEVYGQSLLKDYPIDYAIGLCGEGSECLGYDDEYSTDHDFGPAFCMYLKKEDYIKYGKELQDKYDQLPDRFLNYPKRNTTQEGIHRFGVLCYEDWLYRYLGMNHLPETNEEWLSIKEDGLLNLTNGKLFTDSGFMSEMRSYLAYYPDKVLLKLITNEVGRVAQSGQYNYPRALKRNDTKMAYMCLNEFIQSVIHLSYLLNKQYMPYYKWAMKGMEYFTVLPDLSFKIEQLLTSEEK
ncbi:MAG: DUF4037 domain-containing protein, partial [Erysipelotrichaceae bacterium]|nr:DUF4037 domain-containing protein [Erysipelotrichaceae bacterium]